MKLKFLALLSAFAMIPSLSVLTACNGNSTAEDSSAEIAIDETIAEPDDDYIPHGYIIREKDSVPQESADMDSLDLVRIQNMPADKRDEIFKCRKEILLIKPYIKLDGRRYSLNISREEAVKLGVSPEGYDRMKGELEDANRVAEEAESRGETLELIDFQKTEVSRFFLPDSIMKTLR